MVNEKKKILEMWREKMFAADFKLKVNGYLEF